MLRIVPWHLEAFHFLKFLCWCLIFMCSSCLNLCANFCCVKVFCKHSILDCFDMCWMFEYRCGYVCLTFDPEILINQSIRCRLQMKVSCKGSSTLYLVAHSDRLLFYCLSISWCYNPTCIIVDLSFAFFSLFPPVLYS